MKLKLKIVGEVAKVTVYTDGGLQHELSVLNESIEIETAGKSLMITVDDSPSPILSPSDL